MADATTQTRPMPSRPDDAPEGPKRPFGLSMTQLSGSALAAMTSAVAASFLGVAGTLIGAAVGSIVTTVAGAAYASSLKSAAVRVRTVVVRPGRDGALVASQDDPGAVPTGVGADQVPVADVLAVPSPEAAAPRRAPRPGIRWAPVAVVAALGFVVALGALTLTEGLLGHPVSNGGGTGTTIGRVVGAQPAGEATPSTTPTGTTEPTADPTASATDSATASPSDAAASDAASVSPTSDPAATTATPSQAPTSAPAPTTTP